MMDVATNRYWPVLYMDDFWLLGDKLIALNETVDSVPLSISLSPISQWKFMMQVCFTFMATNSLTDCPCSFALIIWQCT